MSEARPRGPQPGSPAGVVAVREGSLTLELPVHEFSSQPLLTLGLLTR